MAGASNVYRRDCFLEDDDYMLNRDALSDNFLLTKKADNFVDCWESFYDSEWNIGSNLLEVSPADKELSEPINNEITLVSDTNVTSLLYQSQSKLNEEKNCTLNDFSTCEELCSFNDSTISTTDTVFCCDDFSDDSFNEVCICWHNLDNLPCNQQYKGSNNSHIDNKVNDSLKNAPILEKSRRGRKRVYQSWNELEREEMKRERNNKACQKFRRSRKHSLKSLFEKESILLQKNLNLKEQFFTLTKQVLSLKEKLFDKSLTKLT